MIDIHREDGVKWNASPDLGIQAAPIRKCEPDVAAGLLLKDVSYIRNGGIQLGSGRHHQLYIC
jgi:hypothetical protein